MKNKEFFKFLDFYNLLDFFTLWQICQKFLIMDFHETCVQNLKTDKVLTSVVNSDLPLVTSPVIQLFINNVVTSRVKLL